MRLLLDALLALAVLAPRAPALAVEDGGARPSAQEAAGADTDPTKPVLVSLRDEHHDLRAGGWLNVLLLRTDAALLQRQMGGRGIILRADLPLARLDTPLVEATGLGDAYGQALFVFRARERIFLAVGAGVQLPTATERALGTGKWILAPAVVPVVFFPGKRGLALVKVQEWVSVAGDPDRAALDYLTLTPTVLWRLTRRYWTVLDLESRTDWEDGGATWARAGVLLGAMLSARHGLSLKAELPFGARRPDDWTVKGVVFVTRY